MTWWMWAIVGGIAVNVVVLGMAKVAKHSDEDWDMASEEYFRKKAHAHPSAHGVVIPSANWRVEDDGTMVEEWHHTGHTHVKKTWPDGTIENYVE